MSEDNVKTGRTGELDDQSGRPLFDDRDVFDAVFGAELLDKPCPVELTMRDAGTIYSTLKLLQESGNFTVQMQEVLAKVDPRKLGFEMMWPEVIH